MNHSMDVIAALFLIREKEAHERKDYAAAVAYANAYDLLCYAIYNNEECISQFDGYENALALLNKAEYSDIWELEGIYKGW